MSMAAKRQLGMAFWQDMKPPCRRVVLKHHDKRLATLFVIPLRQPGDKSEQCLADIAPARHALGLPPIFHTSNDNGVSVTPDDTMLIQQQCPPHTALCLYRLSTMAQFLCFVAILIDRIIVIAKHTEYTVTSMQPAEHRNMGRQFVRPNILQVAGKDNRIRMLGINTVNGTGQEPLASSRISTNMCVGELHYTITIKGSRQVGTGILHMTYLQLLKAIMAPIPHKSPYYTSHHSSHPPSETARQQQTAQQCNDKGHCNHCHKQEKEDGISGNHRLTNISSWKQNR